MTLPNPPKLAEFKDQKTGELSLTAHRWFTKVKDTALEVFVQSFTAATTVTASHMLDTTAVMVSVYNATGLLITPATVTVTDANTVTLTFGSPTTGTVVIIG